MLKDFISNISAKFCKKSAEPKEHKIRKIKKILVPNPESWRVVTIAILLMTTLWHIQALTGWFNGATLIEQYGMEPLLVEAIVQCPDLLVYSTYVAFGVSLIMLAITGWMFVYYITDEIESSTALNVTLGCAIGAAWAFPTINVIMDLLATAINLRDTSGLDVFQLGINAWPQVVITVICVGLLVLNNRVSKLLK